MIAIRYPMSAAGVLLFAAAAFGQNGSSDLEWQYATDAVSVDPYSGSVGGPVSGSPETSDSVAEISPEEAPCPCGDDAGENGHCGGSCCGKLHGGKSRCSAKNCAADHCHGVCRDPGHPAKPKHKKPGDVDRGDCPPKRYRIPDCRRAGNPHNVACWARCSVTDKYSSWFVGGGAAFFRGRCRKPSEGTWGLDYSGLFGHANVWLNYTRGRNQGGEGAYQTDGEPAIVSKASSLIHFGH